MTRIAVDVCHPAHVHFFRAPIAKWVRDGHDVLVTSRTKDVAINLLDTLGIPHVTLGTAATSPLTLGLELLHRNARLTRQLLRFRADIAVALGGTFAAQSAFFARIPGVVFYDTEIATLQNRITYPLATRIVVPNCYSGWTPTNRTIRYAGYHELSYLHPRQFTPDRTIALRAGLDSDRPTYLVRLVSWTANHDIGDQGLDHRVVRKLVERLESRGKVIVSSETELPQWLARLQYKGAASDIHHLMAHCTGFLGESATMASECAVLGVPAVYAARSFRGYTDEQETRYGLVHNVRNLDADSVNRGVDWLLSQAQERCAEARQRLLRDCVDVPELVAGTVVETAALGRRG